MNINNVYWAKTFVVVERKKLSLLRVDNGIKTYLFNISSDFDKDVVIYKDRYNNYIDLKTGKRYKCGASYRYVGDVWLNTESLVPITDNIEFNKVNISRRRILKRVDEEPKKDF